MTPLYRIDPSKIVLAEQREQELVGLDRTYAEQARIGTWIALAGVLCLLLATLAVIWLGRV
jgi:hypothetical protein